MIRLKVGDIVIHKEYGEGIIVELGEGYIEREFIDVKFESDVMRIHNCEVIKL